MSKTLSILIPAFNEEKNIEKTFKSLLDIVPKYCSKFEIIIINDGSKDKTGEIAEQLSKGNRRVRVIHNNPNRGFGGSYWRGVENAKFEYTMMFWGDNAHTAQSIHTILSHLDQFDVVIPNYTNMNTRTVFRRNLSKLFTKLINLAAGLDVKYYNGTTLYKTKLLKNVPRKSTGFGFQAEVLAYVLKKGASYLQVDVLRKNKPDEKSSAFKIKNILNVISSLFWLLVQFQRGFRRLDEKSN